MEFAYLSKECTDTYQENIEQGSSIENRELSTIRIPLKFQIFPKIRHFFWKQEVFGGLLEGYLVVALELL